MYMQLTRFFIPPIYAFFDDADLSYSVKLSINCIPFYKYNYSRIRVSSKSSSMQLSTIILHETAVYLHDVSWQNQ